MTTYNGTCGDNLTWSVDTDTLVLTISGTGAMTDYGGSTDPPWYTNLPSTYRKLIGVIFERGITHIGANSLNINAMYYATMDIIIPDTVTSIGEYAFSGYGRKYSTSGGGYTLYIPSSVTVCESNGLDVCCPSTIINASSIIYIEDVVYFKSLGDNSFKTYINATDTPLTESRISAIKSAWPSLTTVFDAYGTEATDYTTKTIVKITDNSTPIQVDSAIRDGIGRKIHSTYLVKSDLENIYPIGSVYMSARTDTTPNYTLVESGAQAIGTSYYIDSITAVVNSTGTTYTLSDGTEVNGGSAILPSVGKWETVSLGITGVTAYKRTS